VHRRVGLNPALADQEVFLEVDEVGVAQIAQRLAVVGEHDVEVVELGVGRARDAAGRQVDRDAAGADGELQEVELSAVVGVHEPNQITPRSAMLGDLVILEVVRVDGVVHLREVLEDDGVGRLCGFLGDRDETRRAGEAERLACAVA